MKIILGSASPRRKEILKSLGLEFEIIHPEIDESADADESPEEYPLRISRLKAESAASMAAKDTETVIISCDTIVTIDDMILGKPANLDDAKRMLRILSGRPHRVITSLTMIHIRENKISKEITKTESSMVLFKFLNDSDITAYLSSINYMDKAGSYAIQENGGMIIEKEAGSVSNIIGLPLRLFFSMISELGLMKKIF